MALTKYYYFIIGAFVAIAALSCNKNADLVDTTKTTSNLNVINAVTDIRAIDMYLNGTRQNTTSAIYLFNSSGYIAVPTSEQQYQFKSDTDRTLLADIKFTPAKKDSSYTMLLAGQQGKGNITSIFINDYFPAAVTAKSMVRFVQASPGTASYDVFVGDTLAFKNNAFKASTTFQSVGPGKKTVKVTLAGSATPIFTGTVIIQAGSYYTLYTEGSATGIGNSAFGVAINLSK